MQDIQGRRVNYLRISVTDRCNFRCRYCMPPEGIESLPMPEILTYEELLRVITVLSVRGITRIRLTGGEPLVRKGIVDFIRQVKAGGQVRDLSLTTNGSLLQEMALPLRQAGLDRVNISLDTRDPEKFRFLTGGGDVAVVWQGIEQAIAVGLQPVKLNVVVTEALSDDDIHFFIQQIRQRMLIIRFIECMPIGRCEMYTGQNSNALRNRIARIGCGELQPIPRPIGNGPANYYTLSGAVGAFGFITPMSQHFCHSCNRLRLTADGKIKPCLLSEQELDLKTALRSGISDEQVFQFFAAALEQKGVDHGITYDRERIAGTRNMFQIGG